MTDQPLDEPFQSPFRGDGVKPPGAFDATPRHCLRCSERLYEAGLSACPKCGLQYDGSNPETYRSRPMFLWWKFWLPGVATAVVCGVLSYAVCLQSGELGWALFGAVPMSMGAILGYATRASQWGPWMAILLISLTIVATVVGLFTVGAAGVFCGAMLAAIFIVPVGVGFFLGVLAGYFVRTVLAASSWDQRWFLPLIAFIAFPYVAQWAENRLRPPLAAAEVSTRLSVHATPEEAWRAIQFYEEVEHEPPWLLKLALPRPVGSRGAKERVGDVVRCQYERGYVVKRITQVEEGRRLAFEVIEQQLHFERDVQLLDGAFEVVPRAEGQTELILTTRYQRRLAPKWLWAPTERKVIRTLHGHVLEGMRRKIVEDRRPPGEPPPYRPTQPLPPAA